MRTRITSRRGTNWRTVNSKSSTAAATARMSASRPSARSAWSESARWARARRRHYRPVASAKGALRSSHPVAGDCDGSSRHRRSCLVRSRLARRASCFSKREGVLTRSTTASRCSTPLAAAAAAAARGRRACSATRRPPNALAVCVQRSLATRWWRVPTSIFYTCGIIRSAQMTASRCLTRCSSTAGPFRVRRSGNRVGSQSSHPT
mmetsp:Transcript_22667/g.57545  ORF Transcript_22667/g.57545 Transcript_22667/m.57545 type:complete len:206 (-) Transcript_22667:770-1387(-)